MAKNQRTQRKPLFFVNSTADSSSKPDFQSEFFTSRTIQIIFISFSIKNDMSGANSYFLKSYPRFDKLSLIVITKQKDFLIECVDFWPKILFLNPDSLLKNK